MKNKRNHQSIAVPLLMIFISALFISSTAFCNEGTPDRLPDEKSNGRIEGNSDFRGTGAIEYNLNYIFDIGWHYTYLYKMVDNKPVLYKSVRHYKKGVFDKLEPGVWLLETYSYWNDGHNTIYQMKIKTSVPAGNTVHMDINTHPGFLKGNVTLKEAQANQGLDIHQIRAYSEHSSSLLLETPSRTQFIKGVGSYTLEIPSGEYQLDISTSMHKGNDPA